MGDLTRNVFAAEFCCIIEALLWLRYSYRPISLNATPEASTPQLEARLRLHSYGYWESKLAIGRAVAVVSIHLPLSGAIRDLRAHFTPLNNWY